MAARNKYRFLWKIAGEDRQILKNCNHGIHLRFALSGLIIAVLFLISIVSYHHSFLQIFNLPIFSWVLGFLATLMIFNIYRLNLVTLSPKDDKRGLGYFFSLTVRICFVLFIGLTIIKPLETLIFRTIVSTELAYSKLPKIENAIRRTSTYFDKEIETSESQIALLKEQFEEGRIPSNPNKMKYLEERKEALIKDKEILLAETEKRIDESTYFIGSIILLNTKYPWVWYISSAFLFLFILPFLFKLFIAPSSIYFRSRTDLFRKIVKEEYQLLEKRYPMLFKENFGKPIYLEKHYEDPPFNTIPKVYSQNIGEEEDFLNRLYGL